MTISTTRRALLARGATIAAVLPLATVPALAGPHPDANLLDLYRELQAAQSAIEAVEARIRVEGDLPEDIADACDDRRTIAENILATPAQTFEGLRVKVTAIEWVSGFPDECGEVQRDEWRSLADDIRRLAGRAVQS